MPPKSERERLRELLKSAARAAEQLDSDVRELVTARAWDVLGHDTFTAMWQAEVGYDCPRVVQVIAVDTLRLEGMTTRRGPVGGVWQHDGHTQVGIAEMIGLSVYTNPKNGNRSAGQVTGIIQQLEHGVPAEHVVKATGPKMHEAIETWGTRKRARPRRIGKAPDELVHDGLYVPRRDLDALTEIARQADVPRAEIYRQAIAEYLARWRETRPAA